MGGRRREKPELPYAPMELLHPLALPGAEAPAARLLEPAIGPHRAALFALYRAVLAWSYDGLPGNPKSLRKLEKKLLSAGMDPLATPLAVLAGQMAREDGASPREVAWACLCVSDWAASREDAETAAMFAELAALSWPAHARYAWLAARMLIHAGKPRDAEMWLRRAYRIGTWTGDTEVVARALTGLGVIAHSRGSVTEAIGLHRRAARIAERRRLREIGAIVHHNLFVACAEIGERMTAETSAARAFELYGPSHPKIVELVTDVALFWNTVGLHRRALAVFRALLAHRNRREDRARVLGGAIWAAGGAGDLAVVDELWPEAWALCDQRDTLSAMVLNEMSRGAASVGDSARASQALAKATQIAAECGAPGLAVELEHQGDAVRAVPRSMHRPPARSPRSAVDVGTTLADSFIRALSSDLNRNRWNAGG